MSHLRLISGLASAGVLASGLGIGAMSICSKALGGEGIRPQVVLDAGPSQSKPQTDMLPKPQGPCEQKIDVGPNQVLSDQLIPYLRCTWPYLPSTKGTFEQELDRLLLAVRTAAPYADLDKIQPPLTIRFVGSYGGETVDPRYSGLEGTEIGHRGY